MKSVNRKLMILEALVNTLEQPHMQSVTTKILAEKCDITESALYKHYKNKQEIFEQLFRHVEQTIWIKPMKSNLNTHILQIEYETCLCF